MGKQQSLFPEIDREAREDRRASRRERVQLARNYLRDRDLSWLINILLEDGPQTEHAIAMEVDAYHFEDFARRVAVAFSDLEALCLVGKLWRKDLGIHFGSGERTFLYGIRRVHEKP